MRLIPPLAIPLASALALAGCGISGDQASASPQGSRGFTATGFDAVSLAGSDDVEVTVGPAFSISATGPQAVIDRLNIRVEGTELKIDRKSEIGWNWSGKGAKIRVTMPAIKAAAIVGSGNMRVDKAEGPDFSASLTGSGDMTVRGIKVDALTGNLTGSGDVTLAGSAAKASLSVGGSGSVDADGLTSTTASVSVQGSGDIATRVTGQASGSVAGSGDVNIVGTSNCAISAAGTGNVSCQP